MEKIKQKRQLISFLLLAVVYMVSDTLPAQDDDAKKEMDEQSKYSTNFPSSIVV